MIEIIITFYQKTDFSAKEHKPNKDDNNSILLPSEHLNLLYHNKYDKQEFIKHKLFVVLVYTIKYLTRKGNFALRN